MATKKKKADAEQTAPVPEAQNADAGHFDRDTLQGLSTDALNTLAENMGVSVPDPEDREALIDIIAGEDADGVEDSEPPEAQAPPPEVEAQSVPLETEAEAQKPEPETPPPEQPTPYKAVVVPALLVARREPDGSPVATLTRGAIIRVTGRRDGYAQMENGLYVRESMIRPV